MAVTFLPQGFGCNYYLNEPINGLISAKIFICELFQFVQHDLNRYHNYVSVNWSLPRTTQ